jgi:hypothetical protein
MFWVPDNVLLIFITGVFLKRARNKVYNQTPKIINILKRITDSVSLQCFRDVVQYIYSIDTNVSGVRVSLEMLAVLSIDRDHGVTSLKVI